MRNISLAVLIGLTALAGCKTTKVAQTGSETSPEHGWRHHCADWRHNDGYWSATEC